VGRELIRRLSRRRNDAVTSIGAEREMLRATRAPTEPDVAGVEPVVAQAAWSAMRLVPAT
jgi:hypothetical protein